MTSPAPACTTYHPAIPRCLALRSLVYGNPNAHHISVLVSIPRRLEKEEAERGLAEQLKVLSGELSIKDEALEELAEEMERLRMEQESSAGKDSEKLHELEVGRCVLRSVLFPSSCVLLSWLLRG